MLCPGRKEDKIRVLPSDTAAYMLKAATHVKLFYRYLRVIHIIRSAHGLNLAAEIIDEKLTLLNNLILSMKDVCEGPP